MRIHICLTNIFGILPIILHSFVYHRPLCLIHKGNTQMNSHSVLFQNNPNNNNNNNNNNHNHQSHHRQNFKNYDKSRRIEKRTRALNHLFRNSNSTIELKNYDLTTIANSTNDDNFEKQQQQNLSFEDNDDIYIINIENDDGSFKNLTEIEIFVSPEITILTRDAINEGDENIKNGDSDDDSDVEYTSYKSSRYNRKTRGRGGGGGGGGNDGTEQLKSDHFEVLKNFDDFNFNNIGGYKDTKEELKQCVDILTNYTRYANYNIRVPKGLVLEGPPGNGKTLLVKCLAGEFKLPLIIVSGSEFTDKYVGVGASKVRELFELAKKNIPCIVFIDEIDAVGRMRSFDGEASSSERDGTLNELLVALDGFKSSSGVFMIGATNRIDLLDKALTRPGRIDKKIYVGIPDEETRKEIIQIHIQGKPYDKGSVKIMDLVDITNGLSGADIENLLNEAMLLALRDGRDKMNLNDIDSVYNKIVAGWTNSKHEMTSDELMRICVHEMGHAITGMVSKFHPKVRKVIINLNSPKSPGYTIFETPTNTLYTYEELFERLVILLGGRIAEEIIFGDSITTGAVNDFQETLKLAEKMITEYGFGKNVIYPKNSDKYREHLDIEITDLIQRAYEVSKNILKKHKYLIDILASILKDKRVITYDELTRYTYSK